jgi:hypothetical protein
MLVLSGRQLNAVAEIAQAIQTQTGRSDEITDEDKKGEAGHPTKQHTERTQEEHKRTLQDIRANQPFFPEHDFSKSREL